MCHTKDKTPLDDYVEHIQTFSYSEYIILFVCCYKKKDKEITCCLEHWTSKEKEKYLSGELEAVHKHKLVMSNEI